MQVVLGLCLSITLSCGFLSLLQSKAYSTELATYVCFNRILKNHIPLTVIVCIHFNQNTYCHTKTLIDLAKKLTLGVNKSFCSLGFVLSAHNETTKMLPILVFLMFSLTIGCSHRIGSHVQLPYTYNSTPKGGLWIDPGLVKAFKGRGHVPWTCPSKKSGTKRGLLWTSWTCHPSPSLHLP